MNLSVRPPLAASEKRAAKQRTNWDFSAELQLLLDEYEENGSTLEVDFRKLVPVGTGIDRHTHLLHAYPAKLLLHIPLFFLNTKQLCPPNGTVYDPFCGSGTVLLEAILSERRCIGSDSNPLARKIAKAKTTWIEPRELADVLEKILTVDAPPVPFSPVLRVEHWYTPDLQCQIGKLLGAIRAVCSGAILDFMEVCFSACLKRLSASDQRLSVPVRLKGEVLRSHYENLPTASSLFAKVARQNICRLEKIPRESYPIAIHSDARDSQCSAPDVDLVVTSPPYAGAQKYIRASSLSIGWLGLAPQSRLRNLERKNIGREHYSSAELKYLDVDPRIGAADVLQSIIDCNPLRAHIAAKYLEEMSHAADAIVARMKPDAKLILIAGDNQVCGRNFTTTKFLRRIFELRGMITELELVDTIKSRGLMTKRNKTAGTIEREHVYILRKLSGGS